MPVTTLKKADLLLLLFFLAYCSAVVLRVSIESTGYTSPDSEYYLEAARSLQEGQGFIIRDLYGLHTGQVNAPTPFTAWPIGYPVLVAAASWVSGLSLFWASKLLNLLVAGAGFLLLRRINRPYAFVLASLYGSFTVLEMHSYTWSEATFMLGCLGFVFLLHRIVMDRQAAGRYTILLSLTLAGMFLVRYIGLFAYGLTACIALYTYRLRLHRLCIGLLAATAAASMVAASHLLYNYVRIGHFTGISRIHHDMETPLQVVWMTIKGIAIELFVIRKYYLQGMPDVLTIAAAGLQLAVIGSIWWLLHKQRSAVLAAFKQNSLSHMAILTAVAYLVMLVVLRSISQFDPPNYRLLSPFTYLVLFALVNYIVSLPDEIGRVKEAKYILFLFFVGSLLWNLPKIYLLSLLT
ncbi:hypothetical protein ACXYMU_00135 [Pontibacter sp. CAU 1760]